MFKLKLAIHDLTFTAVSNDDGRTYQCEVIDTATLNPNNYAVLELTPQDVADIVAFNMHRDGEPEGFKAMYERLEPKLGHLPNNLRPIP